MNDNSNDESDANHSDSDLDHDDCGNLSAWEYYTQTYDNPQMFDDSDSVSISRAAATQQGPMPEETTVGDSTSQPEQSLSKRSRSEIEYLPLLFRGEQIPTHLFGDEEQQQPSTTTTSRNFSNNPELSSCSTRDYRRGQHSQHHHHYYPQQPFGNQLFPILPSSIESLVASAPPPPTQDGEHPPSSRCPTAMMMNHATKSWSYPTMWGPHPFDPTTGTSTEATTATSTAAVATATTSTVPSLPPFMHSMLQQHSQPTWPWLSSSMVNNMLTSPSSVQQQPPTATASTPELATAYSHMASQLVSMQQQQQQQQQMPGHFPPPPHQHHPPPPPHQYHRHHQQQDQYQPDVMGTTDAQIVTGDDCVPRNDNDSYNLRSGVVSPLDRSGALELPPFTQEIVPPFQQHQNLRLLLKPLIPYNYYYRDERANILQGLTTAADDEPSDTTNVVAFPPSVSDFSITKMHTLLYEHWYVDPLKPKRRHRKAHGNVNFETLSKAIAQRWRSLPVEGRDFYQNVALLDNIYYHQHVQQRQQEQGNAEEKSNPQPRPDQPR
jgi:hypothetical protein